MIAADVMTAGDAEIVAATVMPRRRVTDAEMAATDRAATTRREPSNRRPIPHR